MSLTLKEIEKKVSKDDDGVLLSFVGMIGTIFILLFMICSYSSINHDNIKKINQLELSNYELSLKIENNEKKWTMRMESVVKGYDYVVTSYRDALSTESAEKIKIKREISSYVSSMNALINNTLKEVAAITKKSTESSINK